MPNINISTEFSSDPHFPMLYDTWCEILRPNKDGSYDISAKEAIKMSIDARKAIMSTGLYSEATITKIEHRASWLAQAVPIEIQSELEELL